MKTDRHRQPTQQSRVKLVFAAFWDSGQTRVRLFAMLLAWMPLFCTPTFAQPPLQQTSQTRTSEPSNQMSAAEFAARISAATSKQPSVSEQSTASKQSPIKQTPSFPPALKPVQHPKLPPRLPPSQTTRQQAVPPPITRRQIAQREPQKQPTQPSAQKLTSVQSSAQAVKLLRNVIDRVANGAAFDAKVRQRVWTAGREIVGVGTYLQAGQGTGRFNLQLTMHDGDGKHTLQQISDGRLAWTKTIISDHVSLRRVDVGRLSEWVREANRGKPIENVPVRLRIGAWTEILDSVQRDYVLQLGTSKRKKLLVISGTLRTAARERIKSEAGAKEWPELFPTHVKIAIAPTPDPETGFGEGLPVRMEFWSDPIDNPTSTDLVRREGRLVSLIELYSIRPITAPPVERFRFENQDARVNFVNETERYLRRYNIRLTETQRKQARR